MRISLTFSSFASLSARIAIPMLVGMSVVSAVIAAPQYPEKAIRLIIPNPPGGGTDILARMVANKTSEIMGWTIVVENKPGAGGNIGLDAAAKSKSDGYTIVMGESSNLAINPSLYSKLGYDSVRDFAPIALVGSVPLVLVVAGNSPYRSVVDLVEHAKAASLTMASAGNGTVGHLAGEMFKGRAGIDLLHVPYKGAAAAMNDTIGGQVSLFFGSLPSVQGQIEAGKLRAIAVTSPTRADTLPDVPTLAESGYAGFDASAWYGLLAPAGTPNSIVVRLHDAIMRALDTDQLRNRLRSDGVRPALLSSAQFAEFIVSERDKWAAVVKAAGAKID